MGCASKDTTHFTGQPEVSASAADTSEIQNTESAETVTESAPPEEISEKIPRAYLSAHGAP